MPALSPRGRRYLCLPRPVTIQTFLKRLSGTKTSQCLISKCRNRREPWRILCQQFKAMAWFVRIETALPTGVRSKFFTCCLLGLMDVTTILKWTCLWVGQRKSKARPRKSLKWQFSLQPPENFAVLWQHKTLAVHLMARSVRLLVSATPTTRVTRHPPRMGAEGLVERWEPIME